MSRSLWKSKLIENSFKQNENNTPILLKKRTLTIMPEYNGLKFKIYNGIRYYEILINEKMISRKFGEFSPTRRYPIHKKKKR